MRLGTRSNNEFIQNLNQKNDKIQSKFLEEIKDITQPVSVKVMLGDSTVTEQKTFDPAQIRQFYEQIIKNLEGWTIQEITITNNEDIRRIFTKFEIKIENYLLSGHMSLQFHVLLYYKPEQRVIECQKELSKIIENTKNKEVELSELGDQFVLEKLKGLGYKDLDYQNLFEIFYENDELRDKIYSEIEGKTDANFQELSKRKTELFNELDSFLIETYQTSPVLIDETRLVEGEEGCLCTFDLEFIKNNSKEGLFDPRKMSDNTKKSIEEKLDQFYQIMNR